MKWNTLIFIPNSYIFAMRLFESIVIFTSAIVTIAGCENGASSSTGNNDRSPQEITTGKIQAPWQWKAGNKAPNGVRADQFLHKNVAHGSRLVDAFLTCNENALDLELHLSNGDLTHNIIFKPETKKWVVGAYLRIGNVNNPVISVVLEQNVEKKNIYIAQGINPTFFPASVDIQLQFSEGSFFRIETDKSFLEFASKCKARKLAH